MRQAPGQSHTAWLLTSHEVPLCFRGCSCKGQYAIHLTPQGIGQSSEEQKLHRSAEGAVAAWLLGNADVKFLFHCPLGHVHTWTCEVLSGKLLEVLRSDKAPCTCLVLELHWRESFNSTGRTMRVHALVRER